MVAGGGPWPAALLDGAQASFGLGVGLLGVAPGPWRAFSSSRRSVVSSSSEVSRSRELAAGVVDHLAGGVALLLDQHQLAVGGLDVGPAGVEGPACLLGRVRELAGPLEQRVAVGEVGAHAAGAGGGLVAAVGGDRLQLAGPAQPGGQLAPHPFVVLDPAQRRLAAAA